MEADNIDPIDHTLEVLKFVQKLLPILDKFLGSITSWKRSPAHNKAVGGVADSWHLQGLAMDVVFDNRGDYKEFAKACGDAGLHAWIESDHVHVQAPPLREKQKVM